MNKVNRLLPSICLAIITLVFFSTLTARAYITFVVIGSLITSFLFIAVAWRLIWPDEHLARCRGSLVLGTVLYGLSVSLLFVTLGAMAPVLLWIAFFSLALILYVLEVRIFREATGATRSLTQKALLFTFLTFLAFTGIDRLFLNVPKTVALEMEWQYGTRQSNWCPQPSCRVVEFKTKDIPKCQFAMDIHSKDLGQRLESSGDHRVRVDFRVTYRNGQPVQITPERIAGLTTWHEADGVQTFHSGDREECFAK